ncbi:hypothetical protein DRQ36_07890, partial [bacterium]
MRRHRKIIRFFAVAFIVILIVAVVEWYALRSVAKAFNELLFHDAMNAASIMIEACRTVYEFQVLREIERESLLIYAAGEVPDKVAREDLERITEEGHLPLAILVDTTGQIIEKSGALEASLYPWITRLPENIPGVFSGLADQQLFGIDREFPLTEGPKGLAIKISNGIVVLFAPEPTIREREKLTVGRLISRLGENPRVRYITLQDESGFIFATKSVHDMSSLAADSALAYVQATGKPNWRYQTFSGEKVFELALRFPTMGDYRGVLRVGLSTVEHNRLFYGYAIQLAIILVLALAVSIIAVGLLMTSKRLAVQKGLSDAILSEMNAVCIAVDRDGIVTLINPAASKLFGIPAADATGKIMEDVLHGDIFRLGEVVSKDAGGAFNVEIKRGDSNRVLEVSTGKLPDGGAFAIAEDVTSLVELRKEAAGAEHLRALGELAAGVAHEVRNPLNAIGIAAQRLLVEFEPKTENEAYRELLSGLRAEIDRLDRVIREFIGLSAPMAPNMVRQPLKPLLNEIADAGRLRAEGMGIEFDAEIDELGELDFDSEQLKKALLNLIKNAVEATP